MKHLTLSGRNGETERTVFADNEAIGIVHLQPETELWRAENLDRTQLHGDRYTSDWNAAKQLALAVNGPPATL